MFGRRLPITSLSLCLAELPTILEYPGNQSVNEGDILNLTCRAVGLPAPSVYFNVNGAIQPNFVINQITVSKVVYGHDAGVYFCVAFNSVGSVESPDALIQVICKLG